MESGSRNFLVFGLIFAGVFLLDVITKWAVERWIPYGSVIEILPFLNLTHIRNRGIVFGFLSSSSDTTFWIITAFSILAFLVLFFVSLKLSGKVFYIFGAMLGGAFGNIFERITKGYVVDFIDLHVGNYHWPAFNLADTSITLGMLALLFLSFKDEISKKK